MTSGAVIPCDLQSAFEDAIAVDERVLGLALCVADLRSPSLAAVEWWAGKLNELVRENPALEPHRSNCFQFLLARHRIAIDSVGEDS